MPIRYMGTKRIISDRVRGLIADLSPNGHVLDLFSGVGCVAESLATVAPIHTNDALSFTAVLARARFKGPRENTQQQLIDLLRQVYREIVESETRRRRSRLRDEQRAIDLGPKGLSHYMTEAKHVANSASVRASAKRDANTEDPEHYRLTVSIRKSCDGALASTDAVCCDTLAHGA